MLVLHLPHLDMWMEIRCVRWVTWELGTINRMHELLVKFVNRQGDEIGRDSEREHFHLAGLWAGGSEIRRRIFPS
jgi:hypothetical protein